MEILYTQNSREVAEQVAKILNTAAFAAAVRTFNTEISVSLPKPIRDVLVVAAAVSSNDWVELLLLLDSLRGCRRVILCLTYMGYMRQHHHADNTASGLRVFSQILESMPINRCIIVDPHVEHLFRMPVSYIYPYKIFADNIRSQWGSISPVIVAPDLGGAKRAQQVARELSTDLVVCRKNRTIFGAVKSIEPIGSIKDKDCIIVDDIMDTGTTLLETAKALLSGGARSIHAYVTHNICPENVLNTLENVAIEKIVLTNSVPLLHNTTKIVRLSLTSLVVEAVRDLQ